MRVAIIGGGAAGCFAAVNIKNLAPDTDVTVYEAGMKLLAKVAITGGGRCNLTNSFKNIRSLDEAYPRGARLMTRLFHKFDQEDTCKWFEDRGVRLVTQDDQCVFPKSQDAMEIVSALTEPMFASGVKVRTNARVTRLEPGWIVYVDGRPSDEKYDAVLVTTGGCSGGKWAKMLDGLDIDIKKPVPSLFSMCIDDAALKSLMGIVVENAGVSIPKTKFRAEGPLLITDWGLSGPAVLKLSSYAANYLAEAGYHSGMMVNWFGGQSVQEISDTLSGIAKENPKKQIINAFPGIFNSRLWQYFIFKVNLNPDSRWCELGTRNLNRLAERLHADEYMIAGKNRFKSEFVTCGGVSLTNLNPETLECKRHPGLYFAGEVTDVDAITGGFNLQAAWTMSYVSVLSILSRL